MVTMFLSNRDEMRKSWRPFIDVSCKILLFFGSVSEKSFKNRPSRNKNCLMQPCLLTNWALFREPFIDASYHVLVHLVMRFQRRILEINQSETRIAYGSCLLTDHDKMSNISWGLSIDASYQFRFIWPSSFREDFLEINQSETRFAYGSHVC
jgi:hypothetical protein